LRSEPKKCCGAGVFPSIVVLWYNGITLFNGLLEFVGFIGLLELTSAEVPLPKMGIHCSNRILLSPNPFADFKRPLSVVTMLNPSEEAMAK
jgi:hypothetical protein